MRRLVPALVTGLALLIAVPLYATRDRHADDNDGTSPEGTPPSGTTVTATPAADADLPGGADADAAAVAAALADRASAELYDRTCSACHGAVGGEGYTIGPRLISATYLASRTDTAMARLIRDGVDGTSMMGFGPARGDLLSAAQVDAMVRWLRAQGTRAP